MKTLWTGKTARQELVHFATTTAAVTEFNAAECVEAALDGGEKSPDGSIKREMLRYWDSISGNAQHRIVVEVRSIAKASDRIMGRNIKR